MGSAYKGVDGASVVFKYEAGLERLHELRGWTRVARGDGTRGWVRSENLFALVLGTAPAGE